MDTTQTSSFKYQQNINDNDKSELNFTLQMPPVPEKPLRYNAKSANGDIHATSKSNVTIGAKDTRAENHLPPVGGQMNGQETDEVDFLLEEIKDIEIPTCRTDSDDPENFEIAGSQADLDLSLHLDSAIDTSWYYFSILLARFAHFARALNRNTVNYMAECSLLSSASFRYSHAYYRQYMNQQSAPWGVPLHCDLRPLKTPTGIIRILLIVRINFCPH